MSRSQISHVMCSVPSTLFSYGAQHAHGYLLYHLYACDAGMRRSAHDGVTRPDSPVRSDSPARPESPLFGHADASTTFQLCSPSWSPWAQSGNGEPRVTLPLTGAIAQPRLYLASASSICMTWQPPEQTACTISKFELQLCEVWARL